MNINHALQEYLLEIEVRTYSQKTIRSYRYNLNSLSAIRMKKPYLETSFD